MNNQDIDSQFTVSKSLINLDNKQYQGDMGLQDYCLDWVSYDTILLNMIDLEDGLKKVGDFYTASNSNIKAWRKGEVKMVGPDVKNYKVGDVVILPGIHGLESGSLYITNINGEKEYIKYGHFASESRIFGKVHSLNS